VSGWGRRHLADPPSDRRLEQVDPDRASGFFAQTIVRTLVCGDLLEGPSAFLIFAPMPRFAESLQIDRVRSGVASISALGFSTGATTLGPALACVADARSGDTIRVFRSHTLVWLTRLLAISRGVTPIDSA
jgi:hypothetical protein